MNNASIIRKFMTWPRGILSSIMSRKLVKSIIDDEKKKKEK